MRFWPFRREKRNRRVRPKRGSGAADPLGLEAGRDPEALRRVRRRTVAWAGLALGLVGLMAALSQSPRLLRRMDTFRVRQVEVRGTRYLAPDRVLELSGLGVGSSVFDPPEPWIAALEEHQPDIRYLLTVPTSDHGHPRRADSARAAAKHRSLRS